MTIKTSFHFKITVVHRRWRLKPNKYSTRYSLIISKEYKKLMKLLDKHKDKQIIFDHKICNTVLNNRGQIYKGSWYDQVTVEIIG